MPEPNLAVKNRRPYWLIQVKSGSGTTKTQAIYSPPPPAGVDIPIASGRLGGMGENIFGAPSAPPHGEEVTYENGEVWDEPADGREPAPINAAAVQGNRLRIAQENRTPSETAQWSLRPGKDGRTYRVNELTGEAQLVEDMPASNVPDTKSPYLPGQDETGYKEPNPAYAGGSQFTDPKDGSVWKLDGLGRKIGLISGPIPGYTPGLGMRWPQQAPQRVPRYADEEEHARLQNEKLRRELQDPFTLRTQQHAEAIKAIQAMLSSGEIGVDQANKLIGLARENMNAALQGTTPWQMQKQQQDLARGMLGDQQQTAGSLATGLLSGLGGIYGKVYSSTKPPAIDPFDLVGPFMQQYGGGTEMGDLAKSILMGAFQQGGL